METDAQQICREMNRCGKERKPFLFGVDFEMKNGFFVENPLENPEIPFVTGQVTNIIAGNHLPPPSPCLEILHTDAQI